MASQALPESNVCERSDDSARYSSESSVGAFECLRERPIVFTPRLFFNDRSCASAAAELSACQSDPETERRRPDSMQGTDVTSALEVRGLTVVLFSDSYVFVSTGVRMRLSGTENSARVSVCQIIGIFRSTGTQILGCISFKQCLTVFSVCSGSHARRITRAGRPAVTVLRACPCIV